MSAPMTAEEIRNWYLKQSAWTRRHPIVVAAQIDNLLALIVAREREHAKLLARVKRLERERDDGR